MAKWKYIYSKGSIAELNGDIQQSEAEERALQRKIEACEKSEREKEDEIDKCERDERRASENVDDQRKAGLGRHLGIRAAVQSKTITPLKNPIVHETVRV